MKKGRILVVDDQEQIIESLTEILSDENHEVLTARDGQEAIHIVQSDSPDVVFLDIWIPGIDGMQTLKAIKRIDPDCAVVMMSGHGTIETAVKAIKLGATDYLEKPLNLEDVLHIVDKAISGRSSAKRTRESRTNDPGVIIGTSHLAQELKKAIAEASRAPYNVWFVGEKGTGKEFLARLVHHQGGRDRNTLVKLRCGALSAENIEDVMLACRTRLPLAENARKDPGTFLLVRVDKLHESLYETFADMILSLGPQICDNGAPHSGSKLRIVSTSLLEPNDLVKHNGFPERLADLLGQKTIRVPSLRDRREDVPLLVQHFLEEAASEFDRHLVGVNEEAMMRLCEYSWPGNIKELKILIEHVAMTAAGPYIQVNDLLIPKDGYSLSVGAQERVPAGAAVVAGPEDSAPLVSE
ncbi:MAG: sigma-54-dependent transcriptional regulator, partial [Desulfomonilaceae bacterium]